jgi:hypothetical protein
MTHEPTIRETVYNWLDNKQPGTTSIQDRDALVSALEWREMQRAPEPRYQGLRAKIAKWHEASSCHENQHNQESTHYGSASHLAEAHWRGAKEAFSRVLNEIDRERLAATEPREGEDSTQICEDCGRRYELSLVFKREDWLRINPKDSGMLCPTCMANRAEKLPHGIYVEGRILFADDVADRPAASQGEPKRELFGQVPGARNPNYLDDLRHDLQDEEFRFQYLSACAMDSGESLRIGIRDVLAALTASQPPQELEGRLREAFDKITCDWCRLGFERLANGMHVTFTSGIDGIPKFRHENTPCISKATEILAALTRGEVGR